MLYDREAFNDPTQLLGRLEESVFRYAVFSGMSFEGGHIDAAFLSCEFTNVEWYWGLFNICVFVGCRFNGCLFQGTNFAGCRFVDCVFEDCRFVKDNLDSECSFENTQWYGSTQRNCEGLDSFLPVEP